MSRRAAGLVPIVLVLAGAGTGCTVGGSNPSADGGSTPTTSLSPSSSVSQSPSVRPTPSPTPAHTRPSSGTCRSIPSYGFAFDSDESPVVDCAGQHTAETYFVGDVADLGLAIDDDRPTYDDLAPLVPCADQLDRYAGSTAWSGTRIGWSVFWPDARDWEAGAHWYRCDVYVAEVGTDGWRSGEPRTDSLAGSGDDMATFLAYQTCMSYDGAEDETSDQVPCTEPHTAELLPRAVDLPGSTDSPYPEADAIANAVESTCQAALVAYVGADRDDLAAVWWPPGPERWTSGDRRVICGVEATEGRFSSSLHNLGTADLATTPFD